MAAVCAHPWLEVAEDPAEGGEAGEVDGVAEVDGVDEAVLDELAALTPTASRGEAAASVRGRRHDSLHTAYKILRARKRRQ